MKKTNEAFFFTANQVDTADRVDRITKLHPDYISRVLELPEIPKSRVLITRIYCALRDDLQWQVDVMRDYPVLVAYQRFRRKNGEYFWETWDGKIRPDYCPVVAFKDVLPAIAYGYTLLKAVTVHEGGKQMQAHD